MSRLFILVFAFQNYGMAQIGPEKFWQHYDTTNSLLQDNMIADIAFDTEGKAWASTYSGSIQYLENGQWKTLIRNHEGWGAPMSIIDIGNKQFMTIGYVGEVLIINHKTLHYHYVATPDGLQFTKGIFTQNHHILLAATVNGRGALYNFNDGHFESILSTNSDPFCITEKPGSGILLSTRNSLYQFAFKHGHYVLENEKREVPAYYSIVYDDSNRFWATSFPEMNLYHNYNDSNYLIKNIPESAFYNFNGKWKYCAHKIKVLSDSTLAMVTQFGAHILIQDSGIWKAYTLPIANDEFDGIQCITDKGDGNIWIGTWHHGIYVIPKKYLSLLPIYKNTHPSNPNQNQTNPNRVNHLYQD